MTVGVDDELRIREYPGDDTATPRAYGFKILQPDDLRVTRTNADGSETVLVRGTHYSVSGAGNPSGGDVTPLAPIVTGTSWRIEGNIRLDQPTDYTAGDDFPAESHEQALDRSMIAHQEARRDLSDMLVRALLLPRGEMMPGLPPLSELLGKFLAFGAGGEPYGASGTGADAALRTDMATAIGAQLLGFQRSVWATIRSQAQINAQLAANPYDFGFVNGAISAEAKFQEMLDREQHIFIPDADFELNDPMVVGQAGKVITGLGRLKWLSGVLHQYGVSVQADDCLFMGVEFHNPNLLSDRTGAKTYGLYNEANGTRAIGCRFVDWDMGFATSAFGEFYDVVSAFNRFRVLGRGEGSAVPSSSYGEDGGDGDAHWGGRQTVAFNFYQAKAGNDCRTGCFVEELPGLPVDDSGADNARMAVLVGNICVPSEDGTGRFRRSFAGEGMKASIVGYNLGRGATWQEYQWPGSCDYSAVGPNIGIKDIDPADQSGAAWSPMRAVFFYYGGPGVTTKALSFDNNVAVLETASGHGFCLQGALGTVSKGISITGGRAYAEVDMGSGYHGVLATDFTGSARISGTQIWGDFHKGMLLQTFSEASIDNVLIDGADDFAISCSGVGKVLVRASHLRNTGFGIELTNFTRADLMQNVTDNVAGLEIAMAGTNGKLMIHGCVDRNGTATLSDFGTNQARWIGESPGYVSDQRVSAAQITNIASWLNTEGKHAGQIVVDANDDLYVATGPNANSAWKLVEDGTTVVPA